MELNININNNNKEEFFNIKYNYIIYKKEKRREKRENNKIKEISKQVKKKIVLYSLLTFNILINI